MNKRVQSFALCHEQGRVQLRESAFCDEGEETTAAFRETVLACLKIARSLILDFGAIPSRSAGGTKEHMVPCVQVSGRSHSGKQVVVWVSEDLWEGAAPVVSQPPAGLSALAAVPTMPLTARLRMAA